MLLTRKTPQSCHPCSTKHMSPLGFKSRLTAAAREGSSDPPVATWTLRTICTPNLICRTYLPLLFSGTFNEHDSSSVMEAHIIEQGRRRRTFLLLQLRRSGCDLLPGKRKYVCITWLRLLMRLDYFVYCFIREKKHTKTPPTQRDAERQGHWGVSDLSALLLNCGH